MSTPSEALHDLVPGATMGDYEAAKGALFNAAAVYVDWEALHDHQPGAIGRPGLILLELARRLP